MHLDYIKIFNSIWERSRKKKINIKSRETVSHMFLDENVHFIDSRIYTCCQPFLYAKHNIDETREDHKY
jgi:hypothetical protein